MSDVITPDGSVISSSQIEPYEFSADYTAGPMVGIVLKVEPSDSLENLTASAADDFRGYRHECTVLIMDDAISEPYMPLSNVVIPPRNRSNVNDYDEDLPRGVSRTLDDAEITENWKNLDPANLDGDWCVVNFIGGSLDRPFIQNWWPHPRNKIDPGTSGRNSPLTQIDPFENVSRVFRRVNGVSYVVTKNGDVYFDTSQAGSSIDLNGKTERINAENGGSVQVDLKPSKQLEFNWNDKVEGLKAGSNSVVQSREPELPHIDQNRVVGKPQTRDTKKSIVRWEKYSQFFKTSSFNVFCETIDSDNLGQCVVVAQDQILITQQGDDEPSALIDISDGSIRIVGKEGDVCSIGDDQVAVATKSGARISLQGGAVGISAPVAVGSSPSPGTSEGVVKGDTFKLFHDPVLTTLSAFATAVTAWSKTVTPAGSFDSALAAFQAAVEAYQTASSQWISSNLTIPKVG